MREHTLEALPYKGERHEKAWGHELWIINNELYCGKLLVFKKDKFMYTYIDTETAKEISIEVTEGDCIHLLPGQPHRMLAIEDGSCIFEVSTKHFDSDSYRIQPGSSQIDGPILPF